MPTLPLRAVGVSIHCQEVSGVLYKLTNDEHVRLYTRSSYERGGTHTLRTRSFKF